MHFSSGAGPIRDVSVLARPSLLGGKGQEPEPIWAERAEGPYVWDSRGRRYLDFVLAFGAVILGHADENVSSAVVKDIQDGVSTTLRKGKQLELADLLAVLVPNAEMTILLKTGSDATSAAVRLARAFKGRDVVLRSGYQGWHDWCAPRDSGIPTAYRELTVNMPFGDVTELRDSFRQWNSQIAAVVVMPADGEVLDAAYLTECRALAHQHGAVFVLDEVRTGFRLSIGGAQEYFNIDADLVALSKAMANGHPIAALVGRRAIMERVADVSMSSVFYRSSDGIAAALATIETLRTSDALAKVWERGSQFLVGIGEAARKVGIPIVPVGVPPMPYQRFELTGEKLRIAEDVFYSSVWRDGLMLHRSHHWFTCASMTSADISWALEVVEAGYRAAARAI
jgi:glutamate-1-semialdehyde aminotransferase